MKKRKWLTTIVSMTTAAILLAACGQNSSGDVAQADSSADAADTVVADTAEVSQETGSVQETSAGEEGELGEEIVVTIWEAQWGTDAYEEALQKLAEEATAAHIDGKNIRVEVQCIPWNNYYETFMTAYTTGTNPDIACQASTAPAQYNDLGVVMDLSPILEEWKAENPEFYAEIGETAIAFEQDAEGKQIGLPFAVDGKGLIYNKEVFETAGITELPTDYDELTEAAEKIAATGVTPFAFRGDHCSLSNFLVFSNGGYNIGTDYSIMLDDEKATHMLDIMQDWWDKGYVAEGTAGYSDDDIRRMLMNGDVGIILSSMPTWVPEENAASLGILPVPMGPDATEETKHNSISYQAYYAYNTTEHPEETLAVLKWWYENNDILYTEGDNSTVPLRASQFEAVMGGNELSQAFYDNYVNNNGVATSFVYPFEHFETWYGVFDGNKVNTRALMNIFTDQDYRDGLEQSIEETKEIFEAYDIEPQEAQ